MFWRLLLCFCLLALPLRAEPDPNKARFVLNATLDMVGRKCLEFGNYEQALTLVQFHQKVLEGVPQHAADLNRLRRFQSLCLLGQGRNLAAFEWTSTQLEGSPLHQGLLRATALARLARFEELREQLARLQQQKVDNVLERFLLESLRFHLEGLQRPLEAEEALRRFEKTLAGLAPYRSDRKPTTGETLYLRLGLSFWQEPLLELIHQENGDAALQQKLVDALFSGSTRLDQLARQNLTAAHLNPEFSLTVLEQLLVVYEDFLAHQWLERAERNREAIQSILDDLQPTVDKASAGFLQDCQRLAEMLLPFCEGLTFQGLTFQPQLLEVHLEQGSLQRLRERFLVAQLEGLWSLSEGPLDRVSQGRARRLLEELQTLQPGGAYRGSLDARFQQLELGVRQKPPENVSGQRALIDTLGQLALQAGDAQASLRLAWLQARLHAAEGSWQACQRALEQVLNAPPEPLALSPREQLFQRQRWRKLYRLWSESLLEQGRPEQALEVLERGQYSESEQRRGAARLATARRLELQARQTLLRERALGVAGGAPEVAATLESLQLEGPLVQPPPLAQWERAREALPAGTAVVCYLAQADRLQLFLLDREGVITRSRPLGKALLDQRVRAFRRQLVQLPMESPELLSSRWLQSRYGDEYRRLALELYADLIEPLEPRLQGKQVVAVVASGVLQYLPFSALMSPSQGGGEFLCQRWAFAQLSGLQNLLDLLVRPAEGEERWCGLGDPDGSLPYARRELQEIASQFRLAQVYVGEQAQAGLLRSARPSPSVLHLATHGSLDSSNPRASYLLMAGNEKRLRIPDIYELSLTETRLVVLSACQSGLGEVEPGSEITSLSDAFRVAGCRTVLASLWKVADQSTSQLMQSFYRHRGRLGTVGALRQAQLELLARPESSHPLFWAPFVLCGDFR